MNHEKPNPSVERTSQTQARRLRETWGNDFYRRGRRSNLCAIGARHHLGFYKALALDNAFERRRVVSESAKCWRTVVE